MELPFDEGKVGRALEAAQSSDISAARAIIAKAREAETLTLEEVATLVRHAAELDAELFEAAGHVRQAIYGRRMILFAPLYWSSHCVNRCLYCGFRQDNRSVERRILTPDEAAAEARILATRGYRRVLLESGEDRTENTVEKLCGIMRAIYDLKDDRGRPSIDRVNVNIAATSTDDYRRLVDANIGTYNLFQETYHRPTYRQVHARGPKSDYVRQITAMDRALEAGIGDVGLGVLWGLHDWRFELLALFEHARHLEAKFGVGPHTLSMPRIRAADGISFTPAHQVSDGDLLRIIAVLRLAVPYAGIVISTRETAEMRRRSFGLGVTQTSAGSSTEVGGYAAREKATVGQFLVGDHRDLDAVVRDLLGGGFIPAFCTACEQRGRTGIRFAKLAKTGLIGDLCTVNSLLALRQYLADGQRLGFIATETVILAEALIKKELGAVPPFVRTEIARSLVRIDEGALARDEYV